MIEILRKSENTNSFGQHQYWAADHAARCTVIFTATNAYPIGAQVQTYSQLGEHNVTSRGTTHTQEQWQELLHEVVYPGARPEYIKQWRIVNKAPPKQHPRRKQRMNPHRRALLTALERHGGGYYAGRGESGVLEYDVSVYGLSFDVYVSHIKQEMREYNPEMFALLEQHMPDTDAWWADTEEQWEGDHYRFGFTCEQIGEAVYTYNSRTKSYTSGYELDYYSINPVTGKAHDVKVMFAGRGGKHLIVTAFDGQPTPSGLEDTIMVADRTTSNKYSEPYPLSRTTDVSEGYTNEWMRGFTQMVAYWDRLGISKLARQAFQSEEQYLVEQLIEQALDERIAEHTRLAATDEWFAPVQRQSCQTQTQGELK